MKITPEGLKKSLQTELVPFSKNVLMNGTGKQVQARIQRNPDPVLVHLAQTDEREYARMIRNNIAIGTAKRNADNIVLDPGYSIVKGRGGKSKKSAKVLKEFAEAFVKRIKGFDGVVRKKALEAIYYGWRPFEGIYDYKFRHKGETKWVPKLLIEKMPEDFRFTTGRELVYYKSFSNPVLFDLEGADKGKFFVCTYDSINNPYGESKLSGAWLADYARSRFFEYFSLGMQRSMGLVKATEGVSGVGAASKSVETVQAELQEILDVLNSHNILINKSGWMVELLNDISFSEGWLGAISFLDSALSNYISVGSLSYAQGEFSSRSQSTVHADSAKMQGRTDAIQIDAFFTDMIRTVIDLNYADVDDADYPELVSNLRLEADIKVVEAMARMGAKIDLDIVASQHRISLATADTKNVSEQPGRTAGKPETARVGAKEENGKAEEESREERDRSDEN